MYIVLVYRISLSDLEIKDTTDTALSVSYINLHEMDSEGRLRTKLYDKIDGHCYMSFLDLRLLYTMCIFKLFL